MSDWLTGSTTPRTWQQSTGSRNVTKSIARLKNRRTIEIRIPITIQDNRRYNTLVDGIEPSQTCDVNAE